MSTNEPTIGDSNVESLIRKAYHPEEPAPGFLPRVTEQMCQAARLPRSSPAAVQPAAHDRHGSYVLPIFTAMGLALAGVLLVCHALFPPHRDASAQRKKEMQLRIANTINPDAGNAEGLKARPRPVAPVIQVAALGETITTADNGVRRPLPDGSVLYVNRHTSVHLDAERQVSLTKGEVFVDVAPRSAANPFVVRAGERDVKALGTKFSVRTDEVGKTGVVVTHGKVQVSGYDQAIAAGQELLDLDKGTSQPAPRVSHVLDWTRELMMAAETPLVPQSNYTGGALVAVDPNGQEAKLSLRRYHVDVHIEDGFARTVIDQTYFNEANLRMEGTFYFPLPPDASLSRLAMYVDGNLMEGGMTERDYARSVYEQIMWSQKDPALLEWVDGSTFKMRVFPLEARQEKRIIIGYTQRLPALYGQAQYRFPAGHSLGLVSEWSFQARIKNGRNLVASGGIVSSDSNPVRLAQHADPKDTTSLKFKMENNDVVLTGLQKNARLDRDVVLNIVDPTGAQSAMRFSTATHEGSRYLMLRYRPELVVQKQRQNRDWVFLFESSGDRDPLLARAQIEVIRALLANAEYHDTFAVLTAGTRVQSFSPQPLPVTPENVKAALDFLDSAHLIGALDLGQALTAARPFLEPSFGRSPHLVHVGSGIAAMGERNPDALAKKLPQGARYVGVGVGKRWARDFMKITAERTGGYFTQINPDESISWRAFDLAATLNTPRLMDIKVLSPLPLGERGRGEGFLLHANSLAQGEELCAIVRVAGQAGKDRPALPTKLTVLGNLDGAAFQQEIDVPQDIAEAGHLPRTWAKLELDRLLAEEVEKEHQVNHRQRIIELSKQMYVMTPYTSLLVLENEQMYKQFKVDRGRKDHWAPYVTPEKIPVVFEPEAGQPIDARFAPKTEKPHANQVLGTIIIRSHPSILTWPNQGNRSHGSMTALHVYRGAFALPRGDSFGGTNRGPGELDFRKKLDSFIGANDGVPGFIQALEVDDAIFAGDWGKLPARRLVTTASIDLDLPTGRYLQRAPSSPPPAPQFNFWLGFFDGAASAAPPGLGGPDPLQMDLFHEGISEAPSGSRQTTFFERRSGTTTGTGWMGNQFGNLGGQFGFQRAENYWGTNSFFKLPDKEGNLRQLDRLIRDQKIVRASTERAYKRIVTGASNGPRMYGRPSFSQDDRVFFDLVAYAPGMNTSQADIEAILEEEASPSLASLPGKIDPAARPLIEKARSLGWQTLTLGKQAEPEASATEAVRILFNGQGRYAYERTTSLGLREQVICDGKTILHLYPDLGIGARRSVSRFHRAEFAQFVPWLVPPIEDLTRGADVKKIGERTIALIPRGAEGKKDDDGKLLPYLATHLTFAADGRLSERRFIANTFDKNEPKVTTLVVETYDADGVIKLANAEGKELSKRTLKLSSATEPSLVRDLSKLVVLPLPWRSPDTLYKAFGIDPRMLDNRNASWAFEGLPIDQALPLLAAEFAQGNTHRVRELHRRCFVANGINKLGYYTLLTALQVPVATDPEFRKLLDEDPTSPLARYLGLQGNPLYRNVQQRWGINLGQGIAASGHFLQRLAEFRDLYLHYQYVTGNNAGRKERQATFKQGLAFAERNKSSVFGWAMLTLLQDRASYADFHRDIANAWKQFIDDSALGYVAKYEYARSLLNGDRGEEAAGVFREMYGKMLEAKTLPPIDSSFRHALLRERKDEWTPLMKQTAERLLKDKHRLAVINLAWQCWQLGDAPLAENLLTASLQGITDDSERLLVTVSAVEYLLATSQDVRADTLVTPLLQNAAYAKRPGLWRLAAQVAQRRDGMARQQTFPQTARAITYLETALDLEFQNLPEQINLQQVRQDYGQLLNHYEWLAGAVVALKIEVPADLAARTIRAADRWRALDRETSQVCDQAARILKTIGARELAWDYLTTPIGMRPNEAGPWQSLGHQLGQQRDHDLADLAFKAAFEAEPTDAQLLWDRAQNLQQAGRKSEANTVLRKIADGDWQPRFSWLKSQARWQLEGR
jgi:hypothetical protein